MESNAAKDSISLLLVGRTGSGKSSTGNTILQQKVFDDSPDFGSSTKDCCLKEGTVWGKVKARVLAFQVLDTPGLFDTDQSHEAIGVLLIKTVINMHPGFHAVLYVIRYGVRYTQEEHAAYTRFKQLLGPDVTGHMMVVLTGGDALKGGGHGAEAEQGSPALRAVLDDCHGRYVLLHNMAANGEKQVAGLLQKVKDLQELNRHRPYVCSGYSQLGKTLEEQVGQRLREVEETETRLTQYAQDLQRRAEAQEEQQAQAEEEHQQQVTAASEQHRAEVARLTDAFTINLQRLSQDRERRNRELVRRLEAQQADRDRQSNNRICRFWVSMFVTVVVIILIVTGVIEF